MHLTTDGSDIALSPALRAWKTALLLWFALLHARVGVAGFAHRQELTGVQMLLGHDHGVHVAVIAVFVGDREPLQPLTGALLCLQEVVATGIAGGHFGVGYTAATHSVKIALRELLDHGLGAGGPGTARRRFCGC